MTAPEKHEAAIAYARRGWAVFPVKIDKRPLIQEWEQVQPNVDRVDRYWSANPEANIGINCGPSGLVVVDLDDHAAVTTLLRSGRLLANTLAQVTPSGGCQYVYLAPSWPLRNTQGRMPGYGSLAGVDFRADGGYVVAPPSHCEYEKQGRWIVGDYEWLTWTDDPAPCPAWIKEPPPRPRPPRSTRPTSGSSSGRLAAIAEVVRSAPEGKRNGALNWGAFRARELDDPKEAIDVLAEAAQASGLEPGETVATIASGLGISPSEVTL